MKQLQRLLFAATVFFLLSWVIVKGCYLVEWQDVPQGKLIEWYPEIQPIIYGQRIATSKRNIDSDELKINFRSNSPIIVKMRFLMWCQDRHMQLQDSISGQFYQYAGPNKQSVASLAIQDQQVELRIVR